MNHISEILHTAHMIAVVGLSSKRYRPSYGVSEYMKKAGYRIIPVNPRETEVLGEKAYPDLDSVPGPVDIVDIFRRSEFVPEIVEAAIRKGARVIWMQEGVSPRSSGPPRRIGGPDRDHGSLYSEGSSPLRARVLVPVVAA